MAKKIIFHPDFFQVYASDPAAEGGRMESIRNELKDYEVLQPDFASDSDILLVHTENHLQRVKNSYEPVYEMALLSAGGAILASEIAIKKTPIFAVIRPPGHHASPEGFWGFCWFNNIAIAIQKLFINQKIQNAVIIDFDYHYGDGTANIFKNNSNINYFSCKGTNSSTYMENIEKFLIDYGNVDLIGVSAGFDLHIDDWGGLLTTEDYFQIGEIIKKTKKPRFAVLEGGYNHQVLGKNVRAFISGFY